MRICYLNITEHIPARDSSYLKGLRECGVEIIDIRDSSPGLKKFLNIYRRHKNLSGKYDVLWVGYSAHILVPFARLISTKVLVFNSLLSFYEGKIISRKQGSWYSPMGIYCWLVDFLAFNFATLNLIENQITIDFISKKFLVPRKKLLLTWTGVNEDDFFHDASIPKLADFTVLFRGALLPDCVIEYFVEAAKILADTDIKFRLLGNGLLAPKVENALKTFNSRNFEWIKERLDIEDLRKKMQETHLQIGWLSDELRSLLSIEHKTFESLVMKIPFLHGRTPGILELLKEDETGLYCNLVDSRDLANKILKLKNNPELLNTIAENGYKLFNENLTSKHLAEVVLSHLKQTKLI